MIQAAQLTLPIPKSLQKNEKGNYCDSAALPIRAADGTVPETESMNFGIGQTGYLEICEGKVSLAVDAMTIHNEYVERLAEELKPKPPWWQFWKK